MTDEKAKSLLAALAGAMLTIMVGVGVGEMKTDFMVLWAAHQVPDPYNAVNLQQYLSQLMGEPVQNWPYYYPPTFLVLTTWFAVLPLSTAYLVWISLSAGLFAASARHLAGPFLILSPWSIYAFMAGQTSPLLGALVVVALMTNRPMSGLGLGLVACIKPHLVMIPAIALLVQGRWSSFYFSVLSALIIVSFADPGLWRPWLDTVPLAAAHSATLSPHLELRSPLLLVPAGLMAVWLVRTASSAEETAVYATGFSLLIMPHSVWYLSAFMVPAIGAYVHRFGWKAGVPMAAILFVFPSTLTVAIATMWPATRRVLLPAWKKKKGDPSGAALS